MESTRTGCTNIKTKTVIKINMKNEFGLKIKKIRKDRGLTQQEFADSLGYAHKSTINKIESGLEDIIFQEPLFSFFNIARSCDVNCVSELFLLNVGRRILSLCICTRNP